VQNISIIQLHIITGPPSGRLHIM